VIEIMTAGKLCIGVVEGMGLGDGVMVSGVNAGGLYVAGELAWFEDVRCKYE